MATAVSGGRVLGLPIGFRFPPTDEELAVYYLPKKALSFPLPWDIIPVADLALIDPTDLPSDETHGDKFFFRRSLEVESGGAGVWKTSRKDELVVVLPQRVPMARNA
ncbi:hypothetical protein BRADI_4g13562v3 [Brachypodium distachyon]|uniref:NAC domain-containing protein n=1 Tax=Brachypodium distachyon TaxID=15368 RepID=A0A0Q3INE8_BRADI|nr:hypothetical protein BRADI_4g13562v3 [Brachypodium distachyon]